MEASNVDRVALIAEEQRCKCPRLSSFCGCTLQTAVYAFSVFYFMSGCISLINGVAALFDPATFVAIRIASILEGSLSIAFAALTWKAAADLRSKYVLPGVIILLCATVTSICVTIYRLAKTTSPEYKQLLFREAIRRWSAQHPAEELLPEQKQELRQNIIHLVQVDIIVYYASIITALVIAAVVIYVLWSFKRRVDSGETFLASIGVHPLPTNEQSYASRIATRPNQQYLDAHTQAHRQTHPQSVQMATGQHALNACV